MRVVVVGEQAAGSPTFSPAPASAGTLKGKEGEFKPCPQASYNQPCPLPQAGTEVMAGIQSWAKVLVAYCVGLILTCSFSSCSPKVEMPPVEVRRGVLGRRHTRFSRSQDT